jgi:hypothetical protein
MPAQIDLPAVALFGVLGVAALALLALIAYIVLLKRRAARSRQKLAVVSSVLVDYFRKTGVDVAVGSVSLQDNDRFTAFVESEPMKQFRLSHIIEIALRDHVQKTCGLQLEKVFWRFPIKVAAQANAGGSGGDKRIEGADDYINEGLVHYKDLPKSEATEIPWEKFEEAAILDTAKTEDSTSSANSK